MRSCCSITERTTLAAVLLLAISGVSNGFVNGPNTNPRSLASETIATTPPFAYQNLPTFNANTALATSSDSEDVLYSFGAEVVPEGQRPVNEYLDMKRAPLFGWGSNEVGLQGLLIRLGISYAAIFALVCYPIAGATFTQDGYLLQKIAAANVGALGFEIALLVRIYSGWGYVGSRLQSKVIEYEETGWYDGNFEPKTEAELKRDKFLFQSDVQPAVDRLKLVTLGAAALWVGSCVALNAANSLKPKFNEYDPRVLKMVMQDEDFANAAAKAAGNRPTYCDNRYYRAVANGGQGC
ncbi:unnamed protein product [Pseudo-nitzschia multistriata]|uniref:Uncharacterized protein n=1 Tax=Pseudo-nitzschia multistriata TaxID=183589 RepID=A0A448ZKA0_9STRA|nr:unnamed protein product [Pseudo-nitzschia multistriata]